MPTKVEGIIREMNLSTVIITLKIGRQAVDAAWRCPPDRLQEIERAMANRAVLQVTLDRNDVIVDVRVGDPLG